MGDGSQASGLAVPEQWGEIPGAARPEPGAVGWTLEEHSDWALDAALSDGSALRGPAGAEGASRPCTIGVITPFLDGSYWNPVLKGIHHLARRRGHRMIVLRGTPAEVRAPSLAREQVDGWIVVLEVHGIEGLARAGVPLVTVSVRVPEANCPSVIPDNKGGIQTAVRHLIEHGHRRIAFVGYFDQFDVRVRFEAYRETLAEAGIPFDPELVVQSDNNWYSGGQHAAPALIARRRACTAAVFATDKNAIGMMPSLKAAGIRIPEDLAIIGFDDVVEAQGTDPPLTTVRQRFEMLGSAACELILARIAGEPVPSESVLTANRLVRRRSCGCDAIQRHLDGDDAPPEDGGGDLARRLVEVLLSPRTLPPGTSPEAVWPGVERVIDGVSAALQGAAPPPDVEIERACRQAVSITPDLGTLLAIVRLLARSCEQRRAPVDGAAARRVDAFLEALRLALARARLEAETLHVHQLGTLVRSNYDVGFALLSGARRGARSLEWLAATPAIWSCLALWDDPATRAGLVVAGVYSRGGDPTPPIGSRWPAEAFPPADLLPPSAARGEHMVFLLPVRTAQRDWGVLSLIGPTLVAMAGDEGTVAMWGTLLGAALERDALMESLSEQHADLQRAYGTERALSATVRELGCPVIPLLPGVLLVPLIGWIDGDRARQVLEMVVTGVNRHGARCVLLDITGVPFVDAQVASSLGETSRAAALLGARVVLVGVRPEIARSLVGVDLGDLSAFSSLTAALHKLTRARARARRARRAAR